MRRGTGHSPGHNLLMYQGSESERHGSPESNPAYEDSMYAAAHRTLIPNVNHLNHVYASYREEVSHEPMRQGTAYAKDFLTPSGSTISDPAPNHPQSVSPWPLSDLGGQLSAPPDASIPSLAERHRCKRRFAVRVQFALMLLSCQYWSNT